ncbi:MAG: 50S ribosomal protein L6 [Candidatus Aenigmatarchaeota archaeon]
METKIKIPEDIEVKKEDHGVVVSQGDKEVRNKLTHPLVSIEIDDEEVAIKAKRQDKKVKGVIGTFASKIKSAIRGLEENYQAKLKILYRHFPMNVKVNGNVLKVTNFLGEKSPREVEITDGVQVKVDDEEIYVEGPDKEKVGQTAARIEQKIQASNKKDRRVFNDGIYIVEKAK